MADFYHRLTVETLIEIQRRSFSIKQNLQNFASSQSVAPSATYLEAVVQSITACLEELNADHEMQPGYKP